MKYEKLSLGGMATTFALALWRNECWDAGDHAKAKRIQKVIERRKIRHGGHVAYRFDI